MATFQTLHTWIGHDAMQYHDFIMLPHALPYTFSQFSMVWGILQRFTMRYTKFIKQNINSYFFLKNDGNVW